MLNKFQNVVKFFKDFLKFNKVASQNFLDDTLKNVSAYARSLSDTLLCVWIFTDIRFENIDLVD